MSREKKATPKAKQSATDTDSLDEAWPEPREVPLLPEIGVTEALTCLRALAGARLVTTRERQALMKVIHLTAVSQIELARHQAKVVSLESELGGRTMQLANVRTMYAKLELSHERASKLMSEHGLSLTLPSAPEATQASVSAPQSLALDS